MSFSVLAFGPEIYLENQKWFLSAAKWAASSKLLLNYRKPASSGLSFCTSFWLTWRARAPWWADSEYGRVLSVMYLGRDVCSVVRQLQELTHHGLVLARLRQQHTSICSLIRVASLRSQLELADNCLLIMVDWSANDDRIFLGILVWL